MRQLEVLTGTRSVFANIVVLTAMLLIAACLVSLSIYLLEDLDRLAYTFY